MPETPTPTPTAEDIAAYNAATGSTPSLNPLRDLSVDDLTELAIKDKSFDLVEAFRNQPELHADQNLVSKSAEVLSRIKQRGFKLADLPSPTEAVKTVYGAAKGLGKQLWNFSNAAADIVAGSVAELTGNSELARGYGENIDVRLAANLSGTEEAMSGLAQLGEKAVGKIGRATGLKKDLKDFTPEEKVADLFADVGKAEVSQQRLAGAGPFVSAVTGGTGEQTLKQAGVTPEQVGELAAGDPASFFLFGRGAALLGKAAGVITPAAIKAVPGIVERAASKALPAIGGGIVEGLGKTAELGAKGITTAGKVASVAGPIAGGISALVGGDITTAGIGGLASGAGGAALKRLGQLAVPIGERVTQLGKQIGGKVPVTSTTAQLGRDVLQALPGAAGEVAKGFGLDLGLAAVTAETPQETAGAVGFGTVLGALGGAARIGSHALSGQLIAPRAYGTAKPVPSSGNFPAFDAMHTDAMKSASPGVQTRLNAIREFVDGAAPGTDVFIGKDSAAVEAALKQAGVSDATAKQWAAQEGFFTADLPGGKVLVMRNVDTAPHESFHAIQDVLGEDSNRAIDRIVRESYGDRWDSEGEKYASRLGKRPDASWQETVLDASGWGLTEAKEKIYRDIYNRIVGETGAEPAPGVVAEMAKASLGKIMDEAVTRNPQVDPNSIARHSWREILSPEEAGEVADRYIAREIAAENFDALFKRTGPTLDATGLPARLANVVGGLLNAVGIEPLAGRTSEFGQVPLNTPVVEAVRKAATGERPSIEAAVLPEAPKVAPPAQATQASEKPAETNEAKDARTLAAEAPTVPEAGGTKSPRELLGVIAEAIANQDGVKINYLSAPDEPAAATSSNRDVRRAIIETYRTMPAEARALWEKNFFPEKVIKTKAGKYQIQGWAPEVFASNAHKLARFLTEVPDAALLSPYAVDRATGTFTVDAWKQLFEDTQQFVQNQTRGATGAGEPLVVPRSVTEAGGYAPPVRPGARPLEQNRADFINLLFNFRLPDSPRIVTGKRPLNILAQDVSVATKPGRIRVPVEPREKFAGEEAERQNIAGREILETNPLRNQLEQAASKAGIAMPSMIEAIQKLNLENIKEVAGTPEQPQFRGNTLTLTAGFQPAAVELAGRVEKFSPDEFRGWVDSIKGAFTQEAWRVGKEAPDRAFADSLRQRYDALSKRSTETLASLKNLPIDEKMAKLNDLSALASQAQFFREAHEAATGTASAGAALRKADPNYKPPFPPEEISGQAMPKKELPPESDPLELEPATNPKSYWLSREGKLYEATEDHLAFSEQYLSGNPKNDLAENWVRINVSPMSEQILTESNAAPNRQQRAALQELAASQDMPVVDDRNITIVESPGSAQFSPKKKADDYELLPPKSGFSKAWILPNGTPAQLGGVWHHQWLASNPEIAAKYGLNIPKFEGGDAEGVREAALKAGFGRVNYAQNSGTLTVEARARDWRKMKSSIERMVESNLDQIDNMSVTLLDETASTVVDSQSAKLFNYDDAAEKLQHLPFISEGEIRGQFQPDQYPGVKISAEDKPTLPEEAGIANYWISPDGTFFRSPNHKNWALEHLADLSDVKNSELTDTLKNTGWARMSVERGEKDAVFIDANALTEKQKSALDVWGAQFPSVEVIDLSRGPNRMRGQFQPEAADQAELLDVPENTSGKQKNLRREIVTAKAKYPEALPLEYRTNDDGSFRLDAKGKPTPAGIPYGLYDTPLAKQAVKGVRGDEARESAIVDAYANKIKSAYREAKKNPAIAAGANWYSLAREKLSKLFGDDTKFFTELLGATSAQTDVPTNFRYSIDAYNNFKAGKYDRQIQKYREGKEIWETGDLGLEPGEKSLADWLAEAGLKPDATRAKFMEWWIDSNDLKPKQSNKNLFGANSDAVLKVLDGSWRESVQGPKTPNFAGNLSGDSFESTVDIWAARLLHRLGNENNPKRWRILPKNETGVSDADFFLGQKAFRKAGDSVGVSPDSLQAILWFYEKDHWGRSGWTSKAGAEKSDFNTLLDRTSRGTTESGTPGKLRIEPEDLDKPTYQNERAQLDFGAQFSPGDAPATAAKTGAAKFVPMPQSEADRIADAIYIAEGGSKAKKPYGILSVKVSTEAEARKVALNTIKNNYKRWHDAGRPGEYLAFLANRYAPTKNVTNDPTGLNNNWLKNVRRLLKSEVVVEPKK